MIAHLTRSDLFSRFIVIVFLFRMGMTKIPLHFIISVSTRGEGQVLIDDLQNLKSWIQIFASSNVLVMG